MERNSNSLIVMKIEFSNTISLYDKYYITNDRNNTEGFVKDLAQEGRDRILQLDYLIKKIVQIENEADLISQRQKKAFKEHVEFTKKNSLDFETTPAPKEINFTHEEFNKYNELTFELELLTEHFYYIAFRLRGIIKHLPGLKSFESQGMRDVRNKLIEHPDKDKDSQIFIRSFGFGNKEIGPVIKAIRYSDQVNIFPDKGLYLNAFELKENIEKALSDYLEKNNG